MAQLVKAFGTKTDDLSPVSGTQIVEGEEGFLQVVLIPHSRAHTHKHISKFTKDYNEKQTRKLASLFGRRAV